MRVIAKRTLREYWEKHGDVEQSLLSWYKTAKQADWPSFEEVKLQFGTAKMVGSDRIIFKIKGNNYRLIVKITFVNQIIWIRFIGTHAEYDKVDAKTV